MRPIELPSVQGKGNRRSEYERTRDKHIRENMWKASQAARKVSSFSGVPFEDLRSVALEAMVKLYDKWDPTKANFSTWLNRSLTYQLLNYLRDGSRMVKFPRLYSDTHMKIRKIVATEPDVTNKQLSERTGIDEIVIQETRQAFQMSYIEIDEDTEVPAGCPEADEEGLSNLFGDYGEVVQRLSNLPENEYNFLVDVYIHKRAQSTIARKYPGATNAERIKERTNQIMAGVLEGTEIVKD